MLLWQVLLLSFASVSARSLSEELGEVVFVAAAFRHGDRSPVESYPTDPYNDESLWPDGWAQLSDLGKQQEYHLGEWLRERYDDFLPSNYSVEDVTATSTDVDRTLMSVSCVLAGLYKPKGVNWHPDIPWTPIPVHTAPEKKDSILAAKEPCAKYDALYRDTINADDVRELQRKYKDVLREVNELGGLQLQDVRLLVDIYDTLVTEDINGLVLPDWTKKYYPQPLQGISVMYYKSATLTETMKRLKCGPLVKEILDHMMQKANSSLTKKIWLYGAHDSILINLQQCLDVYDNSLPPYSSVLLFELYRKHNKHQVVVSYKNSTDIHRLSLPNCGRVCPLDTFKQNLEPVIPDDWQAECQQ